MVGVVGGRGTSSIEVGATGALLPSFVVLPRRRHVVPPAHCARNFHSLEMWGPPWPAVSVRRHPPCATRGPRATATRHV